MRTTDTESTYHEHSCADCYEALPCRAEFDRDCREPLCDRCGAR